MTLLTVCSRAASEMGVVAPTGIVGNSEDTAVALLASAKREIYALSSIHAWQALVVEQTFTTTAAAIQAGAIDSAFWWIIDGTIWDRTNDRELTGPVTPQEWQRLQADNAAATDLNRHFRIRGDDFLIHPVPAVTTDTIAYEYVTRNIVTGSKTNWEADTDTAVLDEELIIMGVKWRFRKRVSQPYDDDLNEYLDVVERAIARDGGKPKLDAAMRERLIVANTPDGSW